MKYINLSNDAEKIIVDDEDYEFLNSIPWHCRKSGSKNVKYAVARFNQNRNTRMHRLIFQKYHINIKNEIIDHINRNGLDNRKSNLRIATLSENRFNFIYNKNYLSSKYRGVSYEKDTKKWRARITVNHKTLHLGRFKTEIEATVAYDKAAEKYYPFYCTNIKN